MRLLETGVTLLRFRKVGLTRGRRLLTLGSFALRPGASLVCFRRLLVRLGAVRLPAIPPSSRDIRGITPKKDEPRGGKARVRVRVSFEGSKRTAADAGVLSTILGLHMGCKRMAPESGA